MITSCILTVMLKSFHNLRGYDESITYHKTMLIYAMVVFTIGMVMPLGWYIFKNYGARPAFFAGRKARLFGLFCHMYIITYNNISNNLFNSHVNSDE